MHTVKEVSGGWQIIYEDGTTKEVIASFRDYDKATVWCERLNKALHRWW